MAFKYGSNATFQADTSSGTLTDYSAYVSSFTFSPERETTELPRLGGNPTAQLAGPITNTFEAEGWYDPTLEANLYVWISETTPTARTIEFGPQGSASGATKYTAECYISTFEVEHPADAAGTWSATFVSDGAATRGTFA